MDNWLLLIQLTVILLAHLIQSYSVNMSNLSMVSEHNNNCFCIMLINLEESLETIITLSKSHNYLHCNGVYECTETLDYS